MRLGRLILFLAWVSFASFLVPSASIQAQTTATIQGTLTDPSGGGITGAVISAAALDAAGKSAETRSGAEGKYSLALGPGCYRVAIQSTSFKRVEQEISLAAGETRKWDVRLELELLSSHVVVTATAEPTTLETTA